MMPLKMVWWQRHRPEICEAAASFVTAAGFVAGVASGREGTSAFIALVEIQQRAYGLRKIVVLDVIGLAFGKGPAQGLPAIEKTAKHPVSPVISGGKYAGPGVAIQPGLFRHLACLVFRRKSKQKEILGRRSIQRDLIEGENRDLQFPGLGYLCDGFFVQRAEYQVGSFLCRPSIQGPGIRRIGAVVKAQHRAPLRGQSVVSRHQAVTQRACDLGVFAGLREQHGYLLQTLISGFPGLQIAFQ